MHEVELGVWKALMIHLLRILNSVNQNLLNELDRRSEFKNFSNFADSLLDIDRFHLVPTFGRDTIRRFSTNTSQLRGMAARNYEDFLQVCVSLAF